MTYGINSADATIGTDMCMQCIAACVIGGVDLAGGQGHSLGSSVGNFVPYFRKLCNCSAWIGYLQPELLVRHGSVDKPTWFSNTHEKIQESYRIRLSMGGEIEWIKLQYADFPIR